MLNRHAELVLQLLPGGENFIARFGRR